VADHLTGGPTAQAVAAAVIDKLVTGQNGKHPLAELPIHLIGHSRGGGMVCELARLLGERGIVVDQLTPLDPHPLTASDPQPVFPLSAVIDTPAAIYLNVVFADVYSQTNAYTMGEHLAGGYNRLWGALTGGYYNNAAASSHVAADVTGINDVAIPAGGRLVPSTLGPTYTVDPSSLGSVDGHVFGTANGLAGLTYSVAEQPAHGSLVAFDQHTGGFTYAPRAGRTDSDRFTFRVSADQGKTWSRQTGRISFAGRAPAADDIPHSREWTSFTRRPNLVSCYEWMTTLRGPGPFLARENAQRSQATPRPAIRCGERRGATSGSSFTRPRVNETIPCYRYHTLPNHVAP
jgi:hypothetical protein